MSLLLAQAAVNDANIHFDKLYSYRIPAELAGRVFPGSMVLVPFGRGSKARMAVVLAVGEVDESDAPKGLKTLYDAAPEDARLTPDLLELVRFLKERTFCTWFDALSVLIPAGYGLRGLTGWSLVRGAPAPEDLSLTEQQVLSVLRPRRKARTDRRPAARGAGKARSAEAC